MVAAFRTCAVAAVLGMVGACGASEQGLSNTDRTTYIAIGAKDGPLTVLSLDTDAMKFTAREQVGIDEVNYIRASQEGRVFALQSGQLNVLSTISLANGSIENLAAVETLGAPTAVEVSADEKFVFTAHFSDNTLSARSFDRQSFSAPTDFTCGWAHQFHPHPNGKWAYAACMKNTLRQFAIESSSSQVVPMATPTVTLEGGPRHLEFHPAGNTLYVLLQISSQVAVFDIDAGTGELLQPPRQIVNSTVGGSKNKSSDLHVTPNGKWLYAFNRKDQDMAVFSVLPDHSLKFQKTIAMDKGEVRDWSMSPDGSYLITASDKGHVGLWSIDNASGNLTLRDASTGHGNAITVAILDDP